MKTKLIILSTLLFGTMASVSAQSLTISNNSACSHVIVLYAHEPGNACGSLVSHSFTIPLGTMRTVGIPDAMNTSTCLPAGSGPGWAGGACASSSAVYDGASVDGNDVGSGSCFSSLTASGSPCGSTHYLYIDWDTVTISPDFLLVIQDH